MPRIRRWFNVSQAINSDPEVRQLKRELGLPGFSMWLEILARTDNTAGLWKGNERDIGSILAGVCGSNTRGSARLLKWVTDIGWVSWEKGSEAGNRAGLIVVNHAEYHTVKEQQKIPHGNAKESFPSDSSDPPNHQRKEDPGSVVISRVKPDESQFEEIRRLMPKADGDPTKFIVIQKANTWFHRQMREGAKPNDCREAVQRLDDRLHKVRQPWAYLTKVLSDIKGKNAIKDHERQHRQFKAEGVGDADKVLNLIGIELKSLGGIKSPDNSRARRDKLTAMWKSGFYTDDEFSSFRTKNLEDLLKIHATRENGQSRIEGNDQQSGIR